jgi:hypothetical protein
MLIDFLKPQAKFLFPHRKNADHLKWSAFLRKLEN